MRMRSLPFCLALSCVLAQAADAPALNLLNQIQERHVAVHRQVSPTVVAVESFWHKNKDGGVVLCSSYGAGVVISPDGLILTSFSAVPHRTEYRDDDAEAEYAKVSFTNGKILDAKILAFDNATEARLLQAVPVGADARRPFAYLEMADSAQAQVGDLVYSAGNPFRTISQDGQVACSVGTISGIYTLNPALNKESRYHGLAIETDAAVNPGSDGGPLVDSNGRLLGLLSLSYCESRWLGSAVPVHLIKKAFSAQLAQIPLIAPGKDEAAEPEGARAARSVEIGLTVASQKAQAAMVKLYVQREKIPVLPRAPGDTFKADAPCNRIRNRPDCPVTGVLVDPKGYILTSAFNVDDECGGKVTINVQLPNGKTVPARRLGRNLGQDIALLLVEAPKGTTLPDLPFIPLEKDPELRLGRFVTVLGCSEDGAVPTRTMGVVSAFGRLDGGVVQTDALINYGNSGGAVVDLRGRLVGIAAHVKVDSKWSLPNSGVGFFAQSDKIMASMDDMKMGFGVGDLRVPQRAYAGFAPDSSQPEYQGVMIEKIEPGSVAWQAKLSEGDIILAVDGMDTPNWPTLVQVLKAHGAGNNVEMTCVRNGKQFAARAVLPERR